ncbi:MAG: helix-turn-helix domain-containing protein [Nanoarchaeota archaeon]
MEKICPVSKIIETLGKKWTLLILRNLNQTSKKRFSELQKDIEKISPRTLSKRLKELEKEKLISREHFNEIPPRVEYYLTDSGEDLIKCFKSLNNWVEKWR